MSTTLAEKLAKMSPGELGEHFQKHPGDYEAWRSGGLEVPIVKQLPASPLSREEQEARIARTARALIREYEQRADGADFDLKMRELDFDPAVVREVLSEYLRPIDQERRAQEAEQERREREAQRLAPKRAVDASRRDEGVDPAFAAARDNFAALVRDRLVERLQNASSFTELEQTITTVMTDARKRDPSTPEPTGLIRRMKAAALETAVAIKGMTRPELLAALERVRGRTVAKASIPFRLTGAR